MLTNTHLAELLGLGAESEEGHRARALRRAGRAAMGVWAEEAAEVLAAGRSLTELRGVGPWVAGRIVEWLAEERVPPEPPRTRRGFLTLAEARATLAANPGWTSGFRADLQMHTTWSDGRDTLPEMVEAASRYGYEHVAITDHSKGLPIANGKDEAALARQWEEIEALNTARAAAGTPPVALRAIEMNLSPEGAGDMDPEFLGRLELVLGAFHSALRLREDQTERYLAALRNPSVDVLAHPRGRRWGVRPGLEADWQRVFAGAAATDTALEIDAFPDRQDLEVSLLEAAREAGCRISIGTDAHRVEELRFIEFGQAAAIRAGIPRERILNFLSPDELRSWAVSRRSNA